MIEAAAALLTAASAVDAAIVEDPAFTFSDTPRIQYGSAEKGGGPLS